MQEEDLLLAERAFWGDFHFPSGGKRSFRLILTFPLGGNAVFAVFYLSAAAETRFSSISGFPQGGETQFSSILIFSLGRNAIFIVLKLSSVDDEYFLVFSYIHPRMTSYFACFP